MNTVVAATASIENKGQCGSNYRVYQNEQCRETSEELDV